jgi:hypothetical protein
MLFYHTIYFLQLGHITATVMLLHLCCTRNNLMMYVSTPRHEAGRVHRMGQNSRLQSFSKSAKCRVGVWMWCLWLTLSTKHEQYVRHVHIVAS